MMNKFEAIDQAWRIATLTEPGGDVRELLYELDFERVLDLLLILRQSPKSVKFPAGFVRRAIEESWTAATLPEKVERRVVAKSDSTSRPGRPQPMKPSDYPKPTEEEFADYVRRAEEMKANKEERRGRQSEEYESDPDRQGRGIRP